MGSDFPLVATAASFVNFNSRSRVGSDVDDYKTNRSKAQFQFALPHGERPLPKPPQPPKPKFQFALPHGERRRGLGCGGLEIEFQFALPCEVKPTARTSFGAGAGYTFT